MTRTGVKVQYLPHYDLEQWGPLAYAKVGDAGFDLRAAIADPIGLRAGQKVMIPTGVKLGLPKHNFPDVNFELQIRSRSGLAAKQNIFVLNSPGTIDAGYTGEIVLILYRAPEFVFHADGTYELDDSSLIVNPGDRMAQGVLAHCYQAGFEAVDAIAATERGENGFGSSGVGVKAA